MNDNEKLRFALFEGPNDGSVQIKFLEDSILVDWAPIGSQLNRNETFCDNGCIICASLENNDISRMLSACENYNYNPVEAAINEYLLNESHGKPRKGDR